MGEAGERAIEQQLVHASEQQRIDNELDDRQAEEPEEEHSGRGKKTVRADRAIACVSIQDSAGDEQPEDDIRGCRAGNRQRRRHVVQEVRQVVENGAEPDHGRLEGDADAACLIRELLHPVEVDRSRGAVGFQTRAQMLRDHSTHHQGKGHADQEGDQPHPGDDRRRAIDSRTAVTPGGERCHISAAHDSRQSCSHTIHLSDHFVAARPLLGCSVFELFV